jgi:predicted NAD/FAD-binding protein
MGAAIWSTGLADILEFPAESFIRFFKNHGLLSLKDRPRWQTVVGGSHSYVKAFLSQFKGQVLRRAKVVQVQRKDGVIHIRIEGFADMRVFDRVVIAAHADEALAMLADPSSEESRLLGSWSYLRNRTLLHTDASFLPPNPRAGASWNYRREKGEDVHSGVSVTYDMNRLQGFSSHKRYLVTLNPRREPLPGSIVREFIYHHPAFDSKAIGAQKQLPSLNGIRSTWYCGSYFGNGFHEDAVVSAVAVARQFIAVQQEVA